MFIDALTIGGANGNPKPIENHAHDPKRYIGDMFAWLHQSIPNEKENLLSLVKLCNQNGKLTKYLYYAVIKLCCTLYRTYRSTTNCFGSYCRWSVPSVESTRGDNFKF